MCDEGVVKVNGKQAKASKEISENDVIEIDTITRYLKFKVVKIPTSKNVSKKEAKELVEILEEKKKDFKNVIDLL